MFKKTLKQLKYILILIVVLICLPHSILPHQTTDVTKSDLEYYSKLNDAEHRLEEYKDDTEALKLKLIQLNVINKSRNKFKADNVKLDILASRVANKMCKDAADNNFISHWNMKGEKPYHRYAFAGGKDHVTENAFGEWTTSSYIISSASISEKMDIGHNSFMSERPPADGQKKTIIDKPHQFVGRGYYLSDKQFRYYEEFIDRYIVFGNILSQLKLNEEGRIIFQNDGKNFPYYMVVYREDFPKPLSLAQLKKKGSYADFTEEEYLRMTAWEIAS
jgi:hypothetical protein